MLNRVLVAFFALSALFSVLSSADLCTFDAGLFYDISSIRDCFRSIPFDEAVRKDTVRELRNLADMYSFKDRSKNSGAPFFIHVDLDAELDRIETAAYLCDYDFHEDVNEVFNRLGDAHTEYHAPAGYASFSKLFPFAVTATENEDGSFGGLFTTAYPTSSKDSYALATGIDLDEYLFRRIIRIQGIDAFEYVQDVGDRAGTSRSRGVRLNKVLLVSSFMSQRIGHTTGLPTDNYYTIEFENGDVLRIEILSCSVTSFKDKNDIIRENQRVSVESDRKRAPILVASSGMRDQSFDSLKYGTDAAQLVSHAPVFEDHELFKPFVSFNKNLKRDSSIEGNDWNNLVSSVENAVTCWYSESNDQPLILRFHTFMPATHEYEAWIESLAQTVDTCFKYGRDHAIDHLIVDVRGNSGGMICAAIAAYQMFNPDEWFFDAEMPSSMFKIMTPYDLRKTPTIQKLVDHDFMNDDRNDPTTGQQLADYGWYQTSVWSNMNGISGEFAAKTFVGGSCLVNYPLQEYVKSPIQPPFKKVLMYTDGLCGSACSLFITKLRYAGIGAIVAKGGRPDEMIESASFSGGNVVEWDVAVALYGPSANIQYFPTSAYVRFTLNEAYAQNQMIPREFERLDPDYRIIKWNFSDDTCIDNIQPNQHEFDDANKCFNDADFDKKISGNILPEFRPPPVHDQRNNQTFQFSGTFCIAETGVTNPRQVFMVQNGSAPWIVCTNPDDGLCIQSDASDNKKVVVINNNVRRSCSMTWTPNNDQGTLCCGDSLASIVTRDACAHTMTFSRMQCGGNSAPSNLRIGSASMQIVEIEWDRSPVADMLEYVLQYSNSASMASPAEIVVSGHLQKIVLNGFEPNQKYYARIAVKNIYGVGKWSAIVAFSTKSIPPLVVIQGGSRIIRGGDAVVFDGKQSYDPNSKSFGNTALQYTWSCTGTCDSYQNIITTANEQNSQQLVLTTTSSSSSTIVSFVITGKVALKADQSICASSSSVVKVLPNGSPLSPMEIAMIDGMFGESSMISGSQPLRLWCETTGTLNVEWSALRTKSGSQLSEWVDLSSLSSVGTHRSLLFIPGGKLESEYVYSFRVRNENSFEMNVTRDFSIIGSPEIGTIQVEPVTPGEETPFTSMFRISVNGWTSSRPLKYAFFVLFDQGGIEMRMPLGGEPSSVTSIQTTLPSPMPTTTCEVVILVKAFDDVGSVAWSTRPFTLGPKVSTVGEALALAQYLYSFVNPKKSFSDISEKLTSLLLVLENTIDNKSSLTNPEIVSLETLVWNVIDTMVEIVQNHSTSLTNDMLNAMSSGVRTVIEYSDAVLEEGYLEKCGSILRAIYKLRSSEDIDSSSMKMAALDISRIINIGKKVVTFNMVSVQETLNEIAMGISYQMRAGDSWKQVDGDTLFLGIVKMSRDHGLSEQVVSSDASNFGLDQPDVTFPDDFQTSCDPNNVFGDMTVKVVAMTSQMYVANAGKNFGAYQISIAVMHGNGSEINVSQLVNGVRVKLRKVGNTKTGSHECVFYNHTSCSWSSEGVSKISEDSMFVTCESDHLSDFSTFATPTSKNDDNGGDDDDDIDSGWIIAGAIFFALIVIGIGVMIAIARRRRKSDPARHVRLGEESELIQYTH